jgi:hypothetical protein
VAVAFGVLTLGAGLSTVPLDSLIHQSGPGGPAADLLLTAVVLVPAAALGTLLAARRPRNPLGWILLAILFMSIAPADQYAALDYRMHHGMLPLGGLAVTVGAAWPFFLLLIAMVLWLFPDGRVPTGRWRRTAVIAVIVGALLALAASGSGVAAVAGHDIRVNADGSLLTEQTGIWNILHGALGALASGSNSGLANLVSNLLTPLGFLAFAACFAVAVLRYRLYEIDRIISRVISYAIMTAMLAGVFAGLVLLATVVLPFKSSVAVAAATLAAAALFNPLRRRVQHAVDRRFNRARYNADQAVAAFAARLKGAVDLDSVRGDLAGVVNQSLEPAYISLWISNRD